MGHWIYWMCVLFANISSDFKPLTVFRHLFTWGRLLLFSFMLHFKPMDAKMSSSKRYNFYSLNTLAAMQISHIWNACQMSATTTTTIEKCRSKGTQALPKHTNQIRRPKIITIIINNDDWKYTNNFLLFSNSLAMALVRSHREYKFINHFIGIADKQVSTKKNVIYAYFIYSNKFLPIYLSCLFQKCMYFFVVISIVYSMKKKKKKTMMQSMKWNYQEL